MDVWRTIAVRLLLGALLSAIAGGCAPDRAGIASRSLDDTTLRPTAEGSAAGPLQIIVQLRGNRASGAHARVASWVKARRGQVLGSFSRAYNGLWVTLPAPEREALLALPEVKALHPVRAGRLCTEGSVPFIGASRLGEALAQVAALRIAPEDAPGAIGIGPAEVDGVDDGSALLTEPIPGVARVAVFSSRPRIAIIDTGVDYTHQSLGGPGGFPNTKVVGGYDFAGDTFNPDNNNPSTWTPRPDPDPMDQTGHGSFVAGVAAGLGVPGRLGAGVAPGAAIYAYKITGPSGQFITPLVVQAIERAMADGVDVINLSLGTNFGPGSDPAIVACENAAAAGIVVVAAAGNYGNLPYSVSSPAVAPSAIAVAASMDAGAGTLRVTEPADLAQSYTVVEGVLSRPLRSTGARSGTLVPLGRACPGDPLPANPTDQIALIDRGVCSFRDKLLVAQAAGAIAVVMVNNVPGPPMRMEGDPGGIAIPAVMVSQEDGERLRAALVEGRTVSVTLAAQQEADRLWVESSRGPTLTSVTLKPDCAAPGYRIYSVLAGSGTGGVAASGTSAAAPHVAGAAALLRQLRPSWSAAEIKGVLMNTALPLSLESGDPAPLVLQGAGRIRVDRAAASESVALGDPGTSSLSFGFQAIEYPKQVSRTIRLRNRSGRPKQYVAEAQLLGPVEDRLRVTLLPSGPFTVSAGAEAQLTVSIYLNPTELGDQPDGAREGVVRITETTAGGDALRVPFHIVPRAASRTAALMASANTGLNRSLVLVAGGVIPSTYELFALGAEDPKDAGYENDIRYIGARASGRTVEEARVDFAVVTYQPWTTPEFMTFRIRVDVNENGQYDATVTNVGTDVWVERLAEGAATGPSPIPALMLPHSGIAVFSVRARDLGLTKNKTSFCYWVESSYGSASRRGSSPPWPLLPLWGVLDRTEKVKFDALKPVMRGAASSQAPFNGSTQVAFQWDQTQRARTPSPGLLVLFPTDAPPKQAQAVPM
jgi:subtilisin family serine protease